MQASRIRATLRALYEFAIFISFFAQEPFTFSEGLASAFDWMPITEHYNVAPSPQSADARAIVSDFIVTGNDMRAALSEYARSE
jgi:hypothetical protein